jgi:hypothetical protein
MAIDAAGSSNPVGALIAAVKLFDKGGRDAIQKLEANPVWFDPEGLQKILDDDKPAVGKLAVPLNRWRATVAKRIDELDTMDEPDELGPGDFDSPVVGDIPPSPIFAPAVILGIGAGGGTDWQKVLRDLAKKDPLTGRKVRPKGVTDQQARRAIAIAREARRAASPAGRLIQAGSVLLAKVPKGLLPDAEVIKAAKTLGKAVRGGFAPFIAQQLGTLGIQAISRQAEKIQFAKMQKILGPQDAAAVALRRQQAKGPAKRLGPAPKAAKGTEPPRPKAPAGGAVEPRKAPPEPKRPSVAGTAPAKPVALKPVRPSGSQMPASPAPKPFPKILTAIGKVADLTALAKLLPGERQKTESRLGLVSSNLAPAGSTRSALTSRIETQTGTKSGCYTVCRKPSTGKKKRKPARVCVTPTAARKAGLIKGR